MTAPTQQRIDAIIEGALDELAEMKDEIVAHNGEWGYDYAVLTIRRMQKAIALMQAGDQG